MVNYLQKIKSGKYSLIIVKDDKMIFKSNNSGLGDLILAYKNGFLEGAVVCDKIVGLAVAKIAIFSKAKGLHALLASELAIDFCQKQKIPLDAEKIVKRIYNPENKKECYFEKMSQKTDNIFDLMKQFEKFLCR